jgi:septum site-determining protein MinD
MLSIDDITDLLGIKLIGIVPECAAVLTSSNAGSPVIRDANSEAGKAYKRIVARFLGEDVPSYEDQKKKGFFKRIFAREVVA